MGGFGSGSYVRWGTPKTLVEDCLTISATRWKREGILVKDSLLRGTWTWESGRSLGYSVRYLVDTLEGDRGIVTLTYTRTGLLTREPESVSSLIQLTTTRPHLGGLRWWFLCPLVKRGRPCARRVGKLYRPPGYHCFGCRHCHDLTYRSCQQSHRFDSITHYLSESLLVSQDRIRELLMLKGEIGRKSE